jgi:hypothetical protein
MSHGGYANLRQAQLALHPFDPHRLKEVALRLRDLYPVSERASFESRISVAFIERLITEVSAGFGGDVGVVPRQFLRQYVDLMDLAAEHPDFDPMAASGFAPRDLSPEEQAILLGSPQSEDEAEPLEGYAVVEF